MLRERKYIIYKKYNKIRHLIFPASYSHLLFARDNGINEADILADGILIDGKICIIDCKIPGHLVKSKNKNIDLNDYHNLRIARELESRAIYKLPGYLREGD